MSRALKERYLLLGRPTCERIKLA